MANQDFVMEILSKITFKLYLILTAIVFFSYYYDKKQAEKQQHSKSQEFRASSLSGYKKQYSKAQGFLIPLPTSSSDKKQQHSKAQKFRASSLSSDKKQHSRTQGLRQSSFSNNKMQAEKQQRSRTQRMTSYVRVERFPENFLLTGTLVSPIGAGLGMYYCWHKVRKQQFRTFLYISIGLHLYGCYRLLTEPRMA
uniref:Uncharacterized protein n=1 Tax=Cacopsylla melanoneura TaxID=428564 RepID=A0A8D8SBY5_9HEMI